MDVCKLDFPSFPECASWQKVLTTANKSQQLKMTDHSCAIYPTSWGFPSGWCRNGLLSASIHAPLAEVPPPSPRPHGCEANTA